jgi:hypothetical protein
MVGWCPGKGRSASGGDVLFLYGIAFIEHLVHIEQHDHLATGSGQTGDPFGGNAAAR